MSYISHEDYKNLMSKFQPETSKSVLKEALDPVGQEDSDIDNDGDTDKTDKYLLKRRKAIGKAIGKGRMMKEGDEVDQKLQKIADLHKDKKIDFETIEKIAKALEAQGHEVNARYVQQFLSQHGVGMNEYGYADNYPGSWGYREEKEMEESHLSNDKWYEDFEDGLKNLANNKYISPLELQYYMKALDHVDPMDNYSHLDGLDAAKEFVDDLRTKDQMDADREQWSLEGGEDDYDDDMWIDPAGGKHYGDEDDPAAMYREGLNPAPMQATGPTVDVTEAEDSNMGNPEHVAKVVAQKHGAELKPLFDKYQASYEEYMKSIKDPNADQQALSKAHNAIVKDFQNQAINWAGHEMLEAGMNKTQVGNLLSGYGYFEDWVMDYVSAINKNLKGMKEGLHTPPLQATGQSLKEDVAPYGFDVLPPGTKQQLQTSGLKELSPDDRKRLKEYIESVKEIQKEIVKLAAKAGKKIKEGGDMTGLTMTPSVTSEGKEEVKVGDIVIPNKGPHKGQKHVVIAVFPDGTFNIKPQWPGLKASQIKYSQGAVKAKPADIESVTSEGTSHEEIEKIESKIPEKLYTAAEKVIDELRKAGLNDGEIKMFLDYEIEERGKEAIMAQHDL